MAMYADAIGGGVLEVNYENGKNLLMARQGDLRQAGLVIMSQHGDPAVLIQEADQGGGGTIKVLSRNRKLAAIIGTGESEEPTIAVFSKDGQSYKEYKGG